MLAKSMSSAASRTPSRAVLNRLNVGVSISSSRQTLSSINRCWGFLSFFGCRKAAMYSHRLSTALSVFRKKAIQVTNEYDGSIQQDTAGWLVQYLTVVYLTANATTTVINILLHSFYASYKSTILNGKFNRTSVVLTVRQ